MNGPTRSFLWRGDRSWGKPKVWPQETTLRNSFRGRSHVETKEELESKYAFIFLSNSRATVRQRLDDRQSTDHEEKRDGHQMPTRWSLFFFFSGTSWQRDGKVLRVLLSGLWLPRNQGWLNFWETRLVTVRKSLHRSCWTELTCQGILLP